MMYRFVSYLAFAKKKERASFGTNLIGPLRQLLRYQQVVSSHAAAIQHSAGC